jgi:hypothetical protein
VTAHSSVPTAESVVGMFDNPQASPADREHLVQVLTTAGVRGRVDRPELEDALQRVFDPAQLGRQVGQSSR